MELNPEGRAVLVALKEIRAPLFWISTAMTVLLGISYWVGLLDALWVVATPLVHYAAIRVMLPAYFGARYGGHLQ